MIWRMKSLRFLARWVWLFWTAVRYKMFFGEQFVRWKRIHFFLSRACRYLDRVVVEVNVDAMVQKGCLVVHHSVYLQDTTSSLSPLPEWCSMAVWYTCCVGVHFCVRALLSKQMITTITVFCLWKRTVSTHLDRRYCNIKYRRFMGSE